MNAIIKAPKFQSTLRRTERLYLINITFVSLLFQSTLRRTERRHVSKQHSRALTFQSTLRRTERQSMLASSPFLRLFQSTLRRTERPSPNFISSKMYCDFNPRSDERSDGIILALITSILISIHAPTNGATVSGQALMSALQNFNPRSDERSDRQGKAGDVHISDFNPRSDERSDDNANFVAIRFKISIHAPTNGATHQDVRMRRQCRYFNPRSDERSDFSGNEISLSRAKFQSTLRRTERRWVDLTKKSLMPFQSTLRRTERRVCSRQLSVIQDFNPRSDERSDHIEIKWLTYLF